MFITNIIMALQTAGLGVKGGFDVGIKIEGFEEVMRKLRALPDAMTRKKILALLRVATRKGGMIKAIKSQAPHADKTLTRIDAKGVRQTYQPGNLAKSIGNITGRSKDWPNIQVGARAGVKRKNDGFYAHFVHEGHRTKSGSMTRKDPFITEGYNMAKASTAKVSAQFLAMLVEKEAKKKGFLVN